MTTSNIFLINIIKPPIENAFNRIESLRSHSVWEGTCYVKHEHFVFVYISHRLILLFFFSFSKANKNVVFIKDSERSEWRIGKLNKKNQTKCYQCQTVWKYFIIYQINWCRMSNDNHDWFCESCFFIGKENMWKDHANFINKIFE